MNINLTRTLAFSDDFISGVLVEKADNFHVEDGIVINLSDKAMLTGDEHEAIVPAWKSTSLIDSFIKYAERVAIIKVKKVENLGGCMFRGWEWLGNRIESFPRDTPLYISPQGEIGTIVLDPKVFTNESKTSNNVQKFTIKLNLWWSPSDTDCFIHNQHSFLEVHTQIYGVGRMQKFKSRDAATIYEDVPMAAGFSHDPFCRVTDINTWTYPWHRYYADTDCVWLAIELHP